MPRPYRLSPRAVRAWLVLAAVAGASRGLLAEDAGDIAARTGYEHADPTRDPRVGTLLDQQALAARRNADAQIGNVHGRLLQLHDDDATFCDPPERPPARRSTAEASDGAPGSDPTAPAASPSAAAVGTGIAGPSVPSAAPPVTLPLNACRRSSVATAWTAGAVVVDPSTGPEGPTFGLHSGGVTLGADRRIASNVVLGVGIGLARERAEAVGDGVRNGVEAQSAVVYLGYRPTPSLTIDAVAGHADLQMRSARRIGERTLSVAVDRPAAQRFASIAAGYRLDVAGTALAPYTRLDAQQATLQAAAEADGNGDALQYQRQDAPSLKLALGIEASSRIETRYGALTPRGKVEMRHELERTGAASIAYADGPAGSSYAVDATAVQRTAWSAGFGAALGLRDDWSVGAVYGFDRSGGSGVNRFDLTLTRRLR